MAKKKNEPTLNSIVNDELSTEKVQDVEIVTDMCELEELSEEAKELQSKAILSMRDQAAAITDKRKLSIAVREIEDVEMLSDILNDSEVLERVKENTKTPMDIKFLAEAQKIKLQNINTMLQTQSVDTRGTATEEYFTIKIGRHEVGMSYGNK